MTKALLIGRFQPLHKGHENAITTARELYDLRVGVGSAQESHTPENPLTADERKQVLENCFPDLPVHRFEDDPDNDVWLDAVEAAAEFEVVISGNDLVRRLFRERGYTVEDPAYLESDRFSGTRIRDRVAAGKEWEPLVPDCAQELLAQFNFVDRVVDAYTLE